MSASDLGHQNAQEHRSLLLQLFHLSLMPKAAEKQHTHCSKVIVTGEVNRIVVLLKFAKVRDLKFLAFVHGLCSAGCQD